MTTEENLSDLLMIALRDAYWGVISEWKGQIETAQVMGGLAAIMIYIINDLMGAKKEGESLEESVDHLLSTICKAVKTFVLNRETWAEAAGETQQ